MAFESTVERKMTMDEKWLSIDRWTVYKYLYKPNGQLSVDENVSLQQIIINIY